MDLEQGSRTASFSDLIFRPVVLEDHDQLKAIHDELFPVKYSDRFFTEAVNGRGLRGGELYTLIAVKKDSATGVDEIVGFIMAQFLKTSSSDDTRDLFESGKEPKLIFYILTLGLTRAYRRSGLGSELVHRSISHARLNKDCGAVYLHVISYNLPALYFYEKNDFLFIREVPDFYLIHGISYSSHLYSFYINGFGPPFWLRVSYMLRSHGSYVMDVLTWLGSSVLRPVLSFSAFPTAPPSSPPAPSSSAPQHGNTDSDKASDRSGISNSSDGDSGGQRRRTERYIDDIVLPNSEEAATT